MPIGHRRVHHNQVRAIIIGLIIKDKLKDVDEFIEDTKYAPQLRLWVSCHKTLVRDYCTLLGYVLRRVGPECNQQEEQQETQSSGVRTRVL